MAAKGDASKRPMSKGQLINTLIEQVDDINRKQVKGLLEALINIGHKELKKNGTFTVPGFAKFKVIKKPATKAREGINPFTGQKQMFAAKPARKVVRARPIKAVKDAVG